MRTGVVVLALLLPAVLAGCVTNDDGDGLDPDAEEQGWVVTARYPDLSTEEYRVSSDPELADTDGDGLTDFQEFQQSTDPTSIDTDRDRLLDGGILCPEAGSSLASAIAEARILEHPEQSGCFLGEASWELDGVSIRTKPTDAHSDNGVGIGDDLADGVEIQGWTVNLGDRSYETFSNPSARSPDSDNDGLHDGHELALSLDPRNPDTDGDGVEDYLDAAPLGNLFVTVTLEHIELKENKRVTGGADLVVDVSIGERDRQLGPERISKGANDVGLSAKVDVPDKATGIGPEGYGPGNWNAPVTLTFWHSSGSGRDEIDVRSGDSPHVLLLEYDAFEDTWTGHARGGTSSGADATVEIDVSASIE